VYSVLHEFVGTAEQFGCDKDNRGGAVSNFLILLLSKVDENFTGWVLDIK
jgi:hypothetical protein